MCACVHLNYCASISTSVHSCNLSYAFILQLPASRYLFYSYTSVELLLASVSIIYRAIEYNRLRFPSKINKPTSIVKNALEEHSSHHQSTWGSVRIREYLILIISFHYIHTSVRHPLFNSIFAPLIRRHGRHLSYYPSNSLKAPWVANSPSNTNKRAILVKRQSKCKLSAAIMQEEKAVSKRHSSSNAAPNRQPRKKLQEAKG